MNLYELIAANTAALEANTAAILGKATTGKAAVTEKSEAATKPAGKPGRPAAEKPKGPSRDEMIAALNLVKEQFGADEAKAIIAKVGAKRMADIADDKVAEAFKLAQARVEDTGSEETGDDDGL